MLQFVAIRRNEMFDDRNHLPKCRNRFSKLLPLLLLTVASTVETRTFSIDYDNDTFLKDGKPFQYVAGSFHYFRALPQSWQSILRSMRAAGLNAITTYVEWSLHNPKDEVYNWDGMADIEHFIQLAADEDLYVILRPGPYICAERDMGGLPAWLLHKYPDIQLRTNDIRYLREIRSWYAQLFSRLQRFLYGQGGPIIMVQVENEYGSFFACDHKYLNWLRDETDRYVNGNAVLFTNNGPGLEQCGAIEHVLSSLDFGAGTEEEINGYWAQLRKTQPKGPLVNAEYYPGWLTHWQEIHMARADIKTVVDSLDFMLRNKVNVNIYMFFGGTNYGFTAGADSQGSGGYVAVVTSYDYDAPLSESGDPTDKYFAIRDTILKYFPTPNVTVPSRGPKMELPPLAMCPVGSILEPEALGRLATVTVTNKVPMSFEELDQVSGLVLYEALIPEDIKTDPYKLTVEGVHDRGYVFVDDKFIGVLSRENLVNSLPISLDMGRTLRVIVENQGRINFAIPNDFKGIVGEVYINTKQIFNWTMYGIPLEDSRSVKQLIFDHQKKESKQLSRNDLFSNSGEQGVQPMTLYYTTFDIASEIADTYLNPSGWGKGLIFINGVNIGRYWPVVGPQVTLYVSKNILKAKGNVLALLEYQKQSATIPTVNFTSTPIFN